LHDALLSDFQIHLVREFTATWEAGCSELQAALAEKNRLNASKNLPMLTRTLATFTDALDSLSGFMRRKQVLGEDVGLPDEDRDFLTQLVAVDAAHDVATCAFTGMPIQVWAFGDGTPRYLCQHTATSHSKDLHDLLRLVLSKVLSRACVRGRR
jgi:hypothetical protein